MSNNGSTVDKSSSRVRRMFDEIAPRYDLLNHLLSCNVDRYWRWRTVRKVKVRAGKGPVLDVCTGTGDLALAFQRSAPSDTRVVGADFSSEMLAIAKQKAAGKGRGDDGSSPDARIDWIEADTQELPMPDNEFQIVSVAFGLRNVADTDRGLAEMVRTCRPGGRVAVLEFTTPRSQPMKALYGWYFRNVLPRIGQWMMRNNSAAYEYLPESVGEFLQYEQLVERMEVAGLVNVRFFPMTFGIATLYVGEKGVGTKGQPAEQASRE